MNRDLITVERHRYTFMDVLSDIGGLQALLVSVLKLLLTVWNYKNFEISLASRLYRINSEDIATVERMGRSNTIKPTKFCNFIECMYDSVLGWLKCNMCGNKSLKMQAIEKARQKMATEMNIIKIVRSRRMIMKTLRLLLTKE